jgi:hypothetical protein
LVAVAVVHEALLVTPVVLQEVPVQKIHHLQTQTLLVKVIVVAVELVPLTTAEAEAAELVVQEEQVQLL